MLNLSKNGIKLLNTHSVVGIDPVWIFSQIFIQSVKLTKILMCLIYRVYPILSITLQNKNLAIKRGLEQKNHAVKKLQ